MEEKLTNTQAASAAGIDDKIKKEEEEDMQEV